MDNARPEPLVPAAVDLRGMPGFMLNVERLLASELVALCTPEEGWAALMLWCRAWQQSPPASLPNDDRILARFSGAANRWAKVKETALHGFVLCSDGRLYHPVLAEEAMKAWKKRSTYKADQERLKRWRGGKRNAARDESETVDETNSETRFTPVSEPEETGTGTGTEKEETKVSSRARSRRSRFPEDWKPDEQDLAFARSRGMSEQRALDEAMRCREFHIAKGNLFADLPAAYRTWVMKAADFASTSGAPNGRSPTAAAGSPIVSDYRGPDAPPPKIHRSEGQSGRGILDG